MAQAARPLTPEVSVRHRFGAELRRWRTRRNLSQGMLGQLVHVSGHLVAKIEKAERWPAEDFARRCDAALSTGGVLLRLLPLVDAEKEQSRKVMDRPGLPRAESHLGDLLGAALSQVTSSSDAADRLRPELLRLPAGTLFGATSLAAWLTPMVGRRHGHLAVVAPPRDDPRPGDLLVAEDRGGGTPRFYAMDARRAQQEGHDHIAVPSAYLVDDLTLGILWAVRALDDALQNDDAPLSEALARMLATETTGNGITTSQATDDLKAVARGWLGSYACARFISANLNASPGPPLFWTREQRGEEAAMWLLFGHKVDYLRAMRGRFADPSTPMVRVFCLPEATAAAGPTAERVLLMLAAALMEAMGVQIHVCAEQDYSTVEGFVLTPAQKVVVASWLGTDRLWHTEVIDRAPVVRAYQEILGYGQAHSILAADTPLGRLQRLADYLSIDLVWLLGRAAQLSAAGAEGFARPRSRLLSTTGIDLACRFFARLAEESASPPVAVA